MKSFNMPSVGGGMQSIERAFAPSSLPPVTAQRGVRVSQAEGLVSREWNEEGAAEVGLVSGAAIVLAGYFTIKVLRKGKK